MNETDQVEAMATLERAQLIERRVKASGRWFPLYMLLSGALAFVLVVAVEAFFPEGAARYAVTAGYAAGVYLLGWWACAHEVHPALGRRRLLVATGVWLGCYLIVIGPVVRWQAGSSPAWWSAAAAAMALPFAFGAWWQWKRS